MDSHTFRDVRLSGGGELAEATIAYRTLGRLNAAGDNVVLVLHGYTTGPSMLDAGSNVAEGSWSELVGPGRAIDSDRYFVVCPNMLGSSYGSTGPGSVNPATGAPYGADFPRIAVEDIVTTQALLMGALGVRRLAAVIGPSFGGYQALQWAVMFPEMVERVISAVSAPFNPASAVTSGRLLAALATEPGWNGGHPAPGAMVDFLTRLRIDTLRRYGVDAELRPRLPDDGAREAELYRLAREWAEGFDAGSLVTLAHAAESFDLRPRLAEIRAPLLWVLSRTDTVFSPALARDVAPLLDAAGIAWTYVEIDSEKGHFASGADARLWSGALREFLQRAPSPSEVPTAGVSDAADSIIDAIAGQLRQLLPGIPAEDLPRFARSVRGGEPYRPGADSARREGVPHGVTSTGVCRAGAVYPGVDHEYSLYVPARYDGLQETGLMVFQDGARYLGPEIDVPAVLDNLIHAGELPPLVAVFVQPGARGPGLPVYGGDDNRSIEYDCVDGDYAHFLIDELLPVATRGLRIATDPAQRAICGISSGGLCAFNVAWQRPDAFGKVVSHCGSFVDIRGGHQLAAAVRRAPGKALRVFLQTGRNDLDILFGSWVRANEELASALAYRGYDHQLVIGEGGHSLAHGGAIFPDTLRWLWREASKSK